jgi:hypothetical protein
MGFVLSPGPPGLEPDQLVNLRTCRCGGICRRCLPEIQRRLAILHYDADQVTATIRLRQRLAWILSTRGKAPERSTQ